MAFRSSSDSVGVVGEFCAYRRASLFYGRNEIDKFPDGKCGLRCAYHGWKYDHDGNCIEMPNEPPTSKFKDRIKLKSY
ncbi:MAG: Rieske 2Fe-2S domain-containing protein [Actinobacteria bacterium]|nr:Rieske 2Fe-2S domain-containing protein [Actinomycetota bacterium]